jgi:bacteriocin-like protein
MNKTMNNNIQEKIDFCDYPYIGIGEKPASKHYLTDEQLEKIIGG